jgi:Phage capsid family
VHLARTVHAMTRDPYRFIPLRRDGAPRNRPADALIRVAVATLVAHERKSHPHSGVVDTLGDLYADDDVAPLLLRAASFPATTIQAGWADSLAGASVADFIGTMGPASAGAALLSRALQLHFGPSANVIVPGLVASASNTSFVQQGAPIPVRQMTGGLPTLLQPHKFATIVPFTSEIVAYSTPSIEALVRAALIESVGLALDVAMFGAAAGSDIVVAGLRNNIAAGTESANPDLYEAMLEDVGTVTTAVAAVSGNNPIAVVAAPARAIRMKLRFMSAADPGFAIFGSNGVAADEVIAIAVNGIVSACDAVVRFSTSNQGTLVMDDAPAQIGDGGVMAGGGARSLFQTDSIALRMIYECSWARRADAAVAWLEDCTW